jgi:pimeloyl-ACP methyl ester carboxylesterase
MTSFDADVDCVRDAIAAVGEPLVLCGHSYGGAVITEAGAGQSLVGSLIDVCAVVPDEGEKVMLAGDPRASLTGDTLLRIEPDQAQGMLYGCACRKPHPSWSKRHTGGPWPRARS